ncbi:HNH endonuclease signature motif containing protein [Desulfobacterales bacterium HSG17]|nr:HNH endonuclease signature motif containing protein [Desulfobacterales bacterium HSG17]
MKTIAPDYFDREVTCTYRGEAYNVGDNGAIYRHPKEGFRRRPLDGQWKFYSSITKDGYLLFAGIRVHQIVATAFLDPQPSKGHIVDHIDTNRQNNRPENLRWVTRLENILLNPITARRVELAYGSIENFFKNPKRPLSDSRDPIIDWMGTVTKEEGDKSYKRLLDWSKKKQVPSGGALGEWLYTSYDSEHDNEPELEDLTKSKTPCAVQKNWKTPCEFPFCPSEIGTNALNEYREFLKEGVVFSRNRYSESVVVSAELSESKETLFVLTNQPGGVKPWALARVFIDEGLFVHENRGSFFQLDGAEKNFTLARGLEWEGGDTIDDYC